MFADQAAGGSSMRSASALMTSLRSVNFVHVLKLSSFAPTVDQVEALKHLSKRRASSHSLAALDDSVKATTEAFAVAIRRAFCLRPPISTDDRLGSVGSHHQRGEMLVSARFMLDSGRLVVASSVAGGVTRSMESGEGQRPAVCVCVG